MNYEKLLEPYKENGRTVAAQITWLSKKGLPKTTIEQALVIIYDEMERGKVYPNGHDLDRALFDKAQELIKADAEAGLKQLEVFHQTLRDKWGSDLMKFAEAVKPKPDGVLTRIKKVFTG